jgi:hypothetical protein
MVNGKLPDDIMREVAPSGRLEKTAARAWLALVAAAKAAGWELTYTYGGMFRSYESQVSLFERRYTPTFNPLKNSTSGSRRWNGKKYWKLRGVAAAATPATSNHGWGLAIDTALGDHPKRAKYIGPAVPWLVENAARFGFSWELQSEPWHIRYVAGDDVPAAVLAYESTGTPVVSSPAPAPEVNYKRPTVRRGMRRSDAVREMQQRLTDYGIKTYVDGWFGRKTDQSVRRFQAENGLAVDGICGPRTWRKLIEKTS